MSEPCAGAGSKAFRGVELFTGVGRRRRFTTAEKLDLVAQMDGCDNISELARRHDLRPSQLFTWRRELRYAVETMLVERDRQITALEEAKTFAEAELARLGAIIAALQRHRFEARSGQLDPDQLQLALEEIDAAVARVQAGLDAAVAKPSEPHPAKRNRGALPAHLERVEQLVDIEHKSCSCCGGALHIIART